MGATATKERQPDVPHLEDCPASRTETYEAEGSRGVLSITRCVDCGAQKEVHQHG